MMIVPRLHGTAEVVTCTLKFPDGREVSGRIREVATRQQSPMIFVGEVSRLGLECALGTAHDMRRLFKRIAEKSGATLSECHSVEP